MLLISVHDSATERYTMNDKVDEHEAHVIRNTDKTLVVEGLII